MAAKFSGGNLLTHLSMGIERMSGDLIVVSIRISNDKFNGVLETENKEIFTQEVCHRRGFITATK